MQVAVQVVFIKRGDEATRQRDDETEKETRVKNFLPPAASEEDTGTPWQSQSQAALHRECAGHAAAQIHLLTSKAARIKRTAQTMMDNTDNRVKVKNFHGIATCAQRVARAFLFVAVKNFHVRCAGVSVRV